MRTLHAKTWATNRWLPEIYTGWGLCAPVENFGKTKSRCQNSVEVVFQIGGKRNRKNWFRITQPIPMRVQGTHV